MKSSWIGVGLGVALFSGAWMGCSAKGSGSSSEATIDAGGGDATTTSLDAGSVGDGAAPKDAASDAPFDAASIDAPEVSITWGNCPDYTPCGGDETGSWKITGGCESSSAIDAVKAKCHGLSTSNEKIVAKGTFTADGTTLTRQTLVKISANANIPQSCVANQPCPTVATVVKAQLGFDYVTCVDGASGTCDCDLQNTVVENVTDTYTKSDTGFATSGGEKFEYCADGNGLTYRQVNAGIQPVVLELTK